MPRRGVMACDAGKAEQRVEDAHCYSWKCRAGCTRSARGVSVLLRAAVCKQQLCIVLGQEQFTVIAVPKQRFSLR